MLLHGRETVQQHAASEGSATVTYRWLSARKGDEFRRSVGHEVAEVMSAVDQVELLCLVEWHVTEVGMGLEFALERLESVSRLT